MDSVNQTQSPANRRTVARRGAARDVVLLVSALLILGFAAFYFTNYGSGREPAPTDAASEVAFFCEACKKPFRLNGKQIEDAMEHAGVGARKSDDPAERGLAFKCPLCGEIAGVRDLDGRHETDTHP